ncbi:alpha/beta hydrolase family protein [Methylococcus mesophilus]|uniref:alpha/beta hydrolase family protein n=1 Tax=Methylococcus mesophilus TaxID=2993564 RepID=UPI00224AA86F|nr:prolyl oligopeptidase family serine peptidase [Methylococcus mesophilus]UZR27988.1 prolyl oligopeptidase family serine peptidase [Methylococcus mesophilus]
MARYAGLIIFVAFVGFSSISALGAMPPGQPDERLIVGVDEVPGDLLSAEEVEKIRILQAAAAPRVLSGIDPAGRVALVLRPNNEDALGFLDIETGGFTPVGFGGTQPPVLDGSKALRWANGTEILTWAKGEVGETPWVLLRVDSITGKISRSPLLLNAGDTPASLSPDGRLLLLTAKPDTAISEGRVSVPRSSATGVDPFDIKAPLGLYASEGEGEGSPRFMVASEGVTYSIFDQSTGKKHPLLTLPAGTALYDFGAVTPYAWSQDGSKLGFVRTIIPIESSRGRESVIDVLTQSALGQLDPADNPFVQENAVEIFDLKESKHSQLLAGQSGGDIFKGMSWSPDGASFMALAEPPVSLRGRKYPIFYPEKGYTVYKFYDATLNPIARLDKPELGSYLQQPFYLSSQDVLFPTVDGLSVQLYRYGTGSGVLEKISAAEGEYGTVWATAARQRLVFAHSSFVDPPELYRMSLDGSAMTALTADNAQAKAQNSVQVHTISLPVKSGAQRSAYLIQPAGTEFPPRNVPMVLWQQGGPGGEMINSWSAVAESPFNLLPNFGISVLMLPLQMRPGWGERQWFDLANGRNFGRIDIDEAAQFVRRLVAKGYTSKQRVGISGCSYGGYFASQSVARHPGLYAAANPACSLLDIPAEFASGYAAFIAFLEGKTPYQNLRKYRADSPVYQAARVVTPTLVFHGSQDFLPVGIAANFYAGISGRGTPARMVEFNGEGHGIHEPKNALYQAQEQIAWFRYYLGQDR